MNQEQKNLERAHYRVKLAEAELSAIKRSRAYSLVRKFGAAKSQLRTDPVGLTKKAAKVLLTKPRKAMRLVTGKGQSEVVMESMANAAVKYQEWILLNEADENELDAQRKTSEQLAYKPLISIITPVFNPPVKVLAELIESVLEQTYPHFELCLGDFGDDPKVRELITGYAKADPRVRQFTFKDNKGISYNSNQILKKVKGDYVALLDHDDTLSPDALYENASLLNQARYDFIYSDKDKIDEDGNRFDPLFKPAWSPEMLLNINYLTHLNVMNTQLVREIGGWDPKTDGAQDWDLFIRMILHSEKVAHIPKILYHWRVISTSTALSIETKPYALAGQRQAVDKYLAGQDIPATSYHRKTELLLTWDKSAIKQDPLVFIRFSSLTNTLRTIRAISKQVKQPHYVLVTDRKLSAQETKLIGRLTKATLTLDNLAQQLNNYLASLAGSAPQTSLFIDDRIRLPKRPWYDNLVGWLAISEVGAVSGRLVDRKDLIIDSGAVITQAKTYGPLFKGYPLCYQSYLGNAEWVRNLTLISPNLFATDTSLLSELKLTSQSTSEDMWADYFLRLATRQRLVMNPHVTASVYEDISQPAQLSAKLVDKFYQARHVTSDPYSNKNMNPEDPMRLFADELLVGIDEGLQVGETVDSYQHDATILANTFDISAQQLTANQTIVDTTTPLKSPQTVGWFLPSFEAVYAGLMNIFSFANYLATQQHLDTTFYILKQGKEVNPEKRLILEKFPQLKTARFVALDPNNAAALPPLDIGICTLWSTAYVLAKHNQVGRKCYFIQDNETNFYPKGTISALVDMSYRFGFTAIANTPGLLQFYKQQYGGHGVVLKSVVNLKAYHPRRQVDYVPKKPYKVFFYARPNMPRNAFELGLAGLKKLKAELGSVVEIITAGADWEPAQYGVEGLFKNLGKIDYSAVPKLYRQVDAGVMFMFSGHPGVTASELMASGCPVVVNEYDDVTWQDLYQDGKTCLVTKPTASEIARNIRRCLEDIKLRQKLIHGGLAKVKEFYDSDDRQAATVYKALVSGRREP